MYNMHPQPTFDQSLAFKKTEKKNQTRLYGNQIPYLHFKIYKLHFTAGYILSYTGIS